MYLFHSRFLFYGIHVCLWEIWNAPCCTLSQQWLPWLKRARRNLKNYYDDEILVSHIIIVLCGSYRLGYCGNPSQHRLYQVLTLTWLLQVHIYCINRHFNYTFEFMLSRTVSNDLRFGGDDNVFMEWGTELTKLMPCCANKTWCFLILTLISLHLFLIWEISHDEIFIASVQCSLTSE